MMIPNTIVLYIDVQYNIDSIPKWIINALDLGLLLFYLLHDLIMLYTVHCRSTANYQCIN